jgi:predicted RNase H-like HicB family nuclease
LGSKFGKKWSRTTQTRSRLDWTTRNERLPRQHFAGDEDGGYIADIPDLTHYSAFGTTPEQALEQVLIARAAWLAVAKAEDRPIPPPRYRPAISQVA